MRLFYLVLALFCVSGGCSKSNSEKIYSIGIDPTFFPLQIVEGRGDLLGFISEVLQEIGKEKKVHLARVSMSWDNLLEGLRLHKYEGALSPAPITLRNKTKYAFSDPLFYTGPILITRIQNPKVTWENLQGKVVALEKTSANIELLSQHPQVVPVFYDSIPEALENTAQGKYAAAIVPVLEGAAYVRDLYRNRLEIASPLLTKEGLRLITLLGDNSDLLTLFNEGLEELKTSGLFDHLATKWNVPKEAVLK